MLRYYFIMAIRNFLKNKGHAFINILGLSIGMASCMLIMLWVQDELSYDRFHQNAGSIYRLVDDYTRAGNTLEMAISSGPMGPALEQAFPEVRKTARMTSIPAIVNYKPENKVFEEGRLFWADPSALKIFNFPLIEGDPETALSSPNSVLITENMAIKYFGSANPVGRLLNIRGNFFGTPVEREYKVTGILTNIPANSHLKIDFIASLITLEEALPQTINDWDYHFFYTYALLQKNTLVSDLDKKLPDFVKRHVDEQLAAAINLKFQPMPDIHLYSNRVFELPDSDTGDINNVYIFSAIALLILLIAAINFMNLATARSAKRAKEVGVKKVLGAKRAQLIWQFLGESILGNVISVLLAIGIIELFLPAFNQLSLKDLTMDYTGNAMIIPAFIAIALIVGILAGSYPALILSAFQPVKVLKGRLTGNHNNLSLRKGLIIFQFGISIVLMVGTGVVFDQLNYFRSKKLGFDKEQIVVLPFRSSENQALKNELFKHPGIGDVAYSFSAPGGGLIQYGYYTEETLREDSALMPTLPVDFHFIDLMGIEMLAGRAFSRDFSTDSTAFVINEAAVKKFGWASPEQALGKRIFMETGPTGEVIGVAKDFHFASLRQTIAPLVMNIDPAGFNNMSIKLNSGDIPATLAFIENTIRTMLPDRPFEFSFLDEQLNNLYSSEMRLGEIFGYFAVLAIFVACLGLFGLASFAAEKRTKEIGVRKVCGASVFHIVLLLSGEFTRLVGYAFIIACPVAYYLMDRWLADFAYRTAIDAQTFIYSGLLALIIALVSVSYNSVKAAVADPVKALRYE